jgi:hypothetical protein
MPDFFIVISKLVYLGTNPTRLTDLMANAHFVHLLPQQRPLWEGLGT